MKLGVVSHTEHCRIDGQWNGLAPTVREIDYISRYFDSVVHAACVYKELPGCQLAPYQAKNIQVVPLVPAGGERIRDKWGVFSAAPNTLRAILRVVRDCDFVQLRLPTGMGTYVLPAMRFVGAKNIWAKYAGNWTQPHPPLSYRFQRWWLKNLFPAPVTVNGNWPKSKEHVLAFENPCLSNRELRSALEEAQKRKATELPLTMCFVGRLEAAKGIERVIAALTELPDKSIVEKIEFIGDGPDKLRWEEAAVATGIKCIFRGTLSRSKLFDVYARSHYLLLPSDSEGFPKVVAEAAAFGVIPIVTAVSSIPQYINQSNGYLWNPNEPFSKWFAGIDWANTSKMQELSKSVVCVAKGFTFERYCDRIVNEVIPWIRERNH